jgi:transcriptional regulator with XRE-family HTH domain
MDINADLVVGLRHRKSWSQEELAIASGLNLRTIQRIEAEGAASLQSKKALAAAFDVEITELDVRKAPIMKKYEYKSVMFKPTMMMLKSPDVTAALNKEGEQGWRLVELVSPSDSMGKIIAVLEREKG